MAETAKKISMIPAKVQYDRNVKLSEKKMKVAAYCRVSTELEEQDSSYEAQVEYYTSKISENENWKNAGIYADDGKSGTNTKKRADFNAMIQDALAGKIDMILTKSVSRFARNTVDSLVTIRKLKEKNVAVVFEKEGINTLEGTGEILITILSSLAQEESRNISENIRWGVVRKFEKGKVIVNCTKFMGYTKNEDGDLGHRTRRGRDRKADLPPLSGRLQYREDRKSSGRAGNQDRHRAGQMAFHGNRQNAPQ